MLLGLAGLIDPIRLEAREAVTKCRQAGIEVGMVTGDHPLTALAIARDAGIAESEDQVVTGRQLSEIDSDSPQFLDKVKHARVFARVTPIQKLQIILRNDRGPSQGFSQTTQSGNAPEGGENCLRSVGLKLEE